MYPRHRPASTQERGGAMSVEFLEQEIAGTEKILSGVSPQQLEAATPCASRKVRDLANHIVGSTYWFAETVETGVAPASKSDVGGPGVTGGDMMAAFTGGSRRAI